MPLGWSNTLRSRLLALVLLAVLPALALLALAAAEQRRSTLAESRDVGLRLARLSAEEEEQLAQGIELLLTTLADVPAVRAFDRVASESLFAAVVDRHPVYANVYSVRPGGSVAASARPFPGAVDVSDREEVREAARTGRLAAGGYRVARATRRPALALAVPIRGGGVVAASLDLDEFQKLERHTDLPPGTARMVVDDSGTVIVHQPPATVRIGRRAAGAPLVDAMLAAPEGALRTRGLDGIERDWAFAPVEVAGDRWLHVAVGASRAAALGPANEIFGRSLAGMIAVGLIALLAAWIGAEVFVVRRTRALLEATRRMAEGDYTRRVSVGQGGDELGELARAFDDMAASITVRRAERDHAERAVRESEQRFRAVVQATNDAVWDWDLSQDAVWWNEGLRAVLGYDPAEVPRGSAWRLERVHAEDRERLAAVLESATSGREQTWTDEYRFQHADGRWLYVYDRGFVVRDAAGNPVRMIGAMMDVTARRRAEEQMRTFAQSLEKRVVERTKELAEANEELASEIRQRQHAEARIRTSQEELREYVDQMSTLNAKVALDGRLLLVNRVFEQGSGFTNEELLEMNFLEGPWWSFDREVQARVRDAFARAVAGETIRYDERVFVFNREITVDLGLAPVRDEQGRVAFIVAEARDITAQKEAEKALQQRTGELEVANKELEAFSYTVSHDLRAPLRAVDGFSRILLEEHAGTVSDEGRGLMRRIRDNAQQMGSLIVDLLSFSRLSRQPLELRTVKPAPLVREVLTELGEDGDRRIEVRVGDLPAAQADPALLKQVYVNLLSNALKYTRGRSVAVIEIGARAADPSGESVYFVRDNGVGFDMRYADRLFGVFQRLHRPEEFEGTGVGLAIAQRIVYRHGGRIWAESEPGRGATFYFTLGSHT